MFFEQQSYLYDAENVILGKLRASKIAITLMGKNKPIYTPSTDTGDFVVVVKKELLRAEIKRIKILLVYRLSWWYQRKVL